MRSSMRALNLRPHTPDDVLARVGEGVGPLPRSADAIVIGGGIMGMATAYYLARAGIKPVVIEKDRVASQQSGRNWGFVRTQYRDPVEMPLALEALDIWPTLEAELGASVGWRATGCLFAAANDAEHQAFQGWLREIGPSATSSRLLDSREIAALLPALNRTAVGALYTPGDGQAEPGQATLAFAQAARAAGAEILEDCGAVAIDVSGNRVTGVMTEHGPIRSAIVICAAGAISHQLLRPLSLLLPQKTVRNTVSLTTPLAPLAQPCFCGFGLGLRQRADGSCIIAAESTSDVDVTLGSLRNAGYFVSSFLANWRTFRLSIGRPLIDDLHGLIVMRREERLIEPRRPFLPPNQRRAGQMRNLLRQLFAGAETVEIEKSWAGAIDVLPDALPVIDGATAISGLVVATGFSGHGFGLGPAVGRTVAAIAAGHVPTTDLSAFRLDRFALGKFGQPHAPL
jgi:glycine/D-amino acid oxidase-like deaminating enzyme